MHHFKIIEREGNDVLFETKVQAGTYIRKLIHDLGLHIGGAHMLELRRIRAGIFEENATVTLYDLEKAAADYKKGDEHPLRALLVPAEIVTTILPSVKLKKEYLEKCLRGSPLFKEFVREIPEGDFCVTCNDQFVGCYRAVSRGDIIASPLFVLN